MKRHGILAGGNWIIDQVKVIDDYPEQDALANILSESSSNGGSPYNILKDLSLLGAGFPLEAVGLIGDDPTGKYILEDCESHKIDTSQLVSTNKATTSYTDVMTVKSSGRRTFFHQRGANALLNKEYFELSSSKAKIFHLGYLLLLDQLDLVDEQGRTQASYLLEEARSLGMMTSVDLVSENSDRFRKIATPSLPYIDFLFANEYEASRLTQLSLSEEAVWKMMELAATRLLEAGVNQWVILHFMEGALAMSQDHCFKQPALKVPESHIVGAAGAGDAFATGVLLGLHENEPMSDCLKLGVCTAAASLTEFSCSAGVRSKEEVLLLAEKWGFQEIVQ